jgi:nucleoside-diphosphate-sugar epimerase
MPAVRQRPSSIADEIIVHDEVSWKAALEGCDSVIHLAARVHVMLDQEPDTLQAFRANNVDTTIELATWSVEAGVRRFVFMSTIKVNGEETAPGRSFSPDDPADPKYPYAISKREAEQGLIEIAHRTGLAMVIICPPLIYGPGVKGNFSSLIRKTGAVQSCSSTA